MAEGRKNIILEGKNLQLGYRKGKKIFEVTSDISFSLMKGELTCLLGPNGVGKSTLLKAILGQNPPIGGVLTFRDTPIAQYDRRAMSKNISVVLTDKITSGNLTVGQLVALGRIPHTGWLGRLQDEDRSKVEHAIESTKIGYLHDRRLSELSDGQLQKVMIARALAQDGELLILDEPTAHLDLVNRYEIMHLLKDIAHRQGKSVLVVTHDLEIAIETADQFWLMECGFPLTAGLPEDLILSGEINRLLPDDQLSFDIRSGKILPLTAEIDYTIDGPHEIVQWVKKALGKAELDKTDFKISISKNPLKFELEYDINKSIHDNIETVIRELTIRSL
ncbi:ABC transporter ATP-binding protein [Anditalea andensis]|uniref:Iron ABC transporter ATP-binding protein n=1 Tax=Anditalea andensis TaxID=1048983 RepID=A0A074L1R5_9BACT|nr:ABC transporter ATP-binding protein [Anditalea andensis]KEO74440.1 iron ABC transporter ATP-binding protein [Anditalea andensis]